METDATKSVTTEEPDAAKSKLPTLPKRGSPFAKLANLNPSSFASPPSLVEQAKADPQTPAPESAERGEGTSDAPISPPMSAPTPQVDVKPTTVPARQTRASKAAKPDLSGETMVLQTSVPLELALQFKMICARSRSSVREELGKMVQAFVNKAS